MATDVQSEVLYSAEQVQSNKRVRKLTELFQIKIPTELHGVLKEYTKAVIRSQPENILQFSAKSSY